MKSLRGRSAEACAPRSRHGQCLPRAAAVRRRRSPPVRLLECL